MHIPMTITISYLLSVQTAATIIGFADSISGPLTVQVCNSGTYPKVCCVPLDVNIQGSGWGWFRATNVGFANVDSYHRFSAVYPMVDAPPCFGQIISHHMGTQDWEANGASLMGGAGSALTMQEVGSSQMHTKFPDFIIRNGVRFESLGRSPTGIFRYRSAEGVTIYGRAYGLGGLTVSNSTNSSVLSSEATKNGSAFLELLAEQ